MATTYGMGGNMSGMTTSGYTRNMSLPLSMNQPITVDENTPNLEVIQSFPVAGRTLDGKHFHQDPVTGQMYRMTDAFHDMIPQILANRMSPTVTAPTMTTTMPTITMGGEAVPSNVNTGEGIIIPRYEPLNNQVQTEPNVLIGGYTDTVPVQTTKIDTTIKRDFINSDIIRINKSMQLAQTNAFQSLNENVGKNQNIKSENYSDINKFTSLDYKQNTALQVKNIYPINKFINNLENYSNMAAGIKSYTPINSFNNVSPFNEISSYKNRILNSPINNFYNR